MSMTNIGRDNADASYRYKMPVIQTKIEGRGNGIKTVIMNMQDIAKSLHIDPHYPTKYFGIEVGAQSKYDQSREGVAIVNGAHNLPELVKILDKFIQTFILCPICKLPELKHTVKSAIKIDCAACGANSTIKTAHKLAQYMIKNPPGSFGNEDKRPRKLKAKDIAVDEEVDEKVKVDPTQATSPTEKPKKKKVPKHVQKKGASEASAAEGGNDNETEDEDEETEDNTKATAAAVVEKSEKTEKKTKKPEKEKKKDKKNKKNKEKKSTSSSEESGSEEETEVWHTDTSKEAQKLRQEAEFKEALEKSQQKQVELIVNQAKTDNKDQSPVTILKIFLAQAQRNNTEILAELRRLGLARGLDEPQKIKILLEAIIDTSNPKTVPNQFAKHAQLLKKFTTDRVGSLQLISCIVELVGVVNNKLLPFISHLLKSCYENDILDEESILAWADAPPESAWLVNKEVAALVRSKAEPFIHWLKNAEEEGEEEDDD